MEFLEDNGPYAIIAAAIGYALRLVSQHFVGASERLETELRKDIAAGVKETARLCGIIDGNAERMDALERDGTEKDNKIAQLERNFNAVSAALTDVQRLQQETLEALERQLTENGKLTAESIALEKLYNRLLDEHKTLKTKYNELEHALTLVGERVNPPLEATNE